MQITVDSAGAISAGADVTLSDGTLLTVTGGSLSVTSTGAIAGSLSFSNTESVTINSAQLDAAKTIVSGVVTGSDGFQELIVAIKTGGSFATADLAGTWQLYAFGDSTVANDPRWDRGTIAVNASGAVVGGSLTRDDASVRTVTGGSLSIDSAGLISGSMTLSNGQSPAVSTKMDVGKTTFAGVNTDGTTPGFLIAVKRAGSFSTADLEGTWQLFDFRDVRTPNPNNPSWGGGTISVDSGGTIIGGSTTRTGAVTGGSLSIDATTGAITGRISLVDGTVTSVLATMNQGKTIVTGVDSDSPGSFLDMLVLVKAVSAVTGISPDRIDLAAAPESFTITGGGFADSGAGLPV